MLGLKDFIHLPAIDPIFDEIATGDPNLTVVAGLEPRPLVAQSRRLDLQPSGRATIFGILFRQMLAAHPGRAVVIADSEDDVRVPRGHRRRVDYVLTSGRSTFASEVERALARGAGLLIIDRLSVETAPVALRATQRGVRVLVQFDSIYRGRDVAMQMGALGLAPTELFRLGYVVAVTRMPALCENCRRPDRLDRPIHAEIRRRYPHALSEGTFFVEGSCAECNQTGRKGQVTTFDIFRTPAGRTNPYEGQSICSLEDYVLGLAAQGLLPAEDVLALDARQLAQTYQLLTVSEEVLAETNAALQGKVAELQASNRVLKKQTEAAISLEGVSHALITYTALHELADYVCRKARELCGADRAILYLLHPDDQAEILAVNGWGPTLLHRRLDTHLVLNAGGQIENGGRAEPHPFQGWPPGLEMQSPDVQGARLRAGLRVPLVAQNEIVGLLIFHSTVKQSWLPREVALLSAFADSSALAIQRAGLVESLRDKIDQLTAAQEQIAKKERLERELELARQVQQSMLPHIFPLVPGLTFAARSEPARQVGGDFYDAFTLDGNRCGLVIADVSDKGMPAALFMALARSLILAEARRDPSPATVLQRVHNLLLELSQSDQFVTVFYGVVDTSAWSLTYVRAGHERPLLLRNGEIVTLHGQGMVLGGYGLARLPLSEERLALEAGDRLVLYTDGLVDAMSSQGQAFGLDRLTTLVRANSAVPVAQMCDSLFEGVMSFQGQSEQYDDMTLLAVQVS